MNLRKITSCWCCLVAFVIGLQTATADESAHAPMSAEQAFENLKANAQVRWLVRLVPYEPNEPELQGDNLKTLAAPSVDYAFVADHAELRGYTAREAARKAGIALADGQGVTAILFPIGNHTIFPGSVRGLLQVVQQIDMRRAAEADYRAAPLDILLTEAELANLAAVDLDSWAWDRYRQYFSGFANAVATLRRKNASAIGHIDSIGSEWCEPGGWRIEHPTSPAEENLMTLDLPGGRKFEIKNFGVRVFLIRNVPLDLLTGHKRIDFDRPREQRIPALD